MIVVIATLHAREGMEQRLRDAMLVLVVASRQEKGNIRYDLLVGEEDSRDVALYEMWENSITLNAHLRSKHVGDAHKVVAELGDAPPRVVSYDLVEPGGETSAGTTRLLDS